MDQFTTAYIECALWASTAEYCEECGKDRDTCDETCSCGGSWESEPLDANFDPSDLAEETLSHMEADCASFQADNAADLAIWYSEAGETAERAGYDFWLTRNRHGAGFWARWSGDSPQAKIGQRLTEAAHTYSSEYLYVKDGRIYVQ